jgi:hypothetical protein
MKSNNFITEPLILDALTMRQCTGYCNKFSQAGPICNAVRSKKERRTRPSSWCNVVDDEGGVKARTREGLLLSRVFTREKRGAAAQQQQQATFVHFVRTRNDRNNAGGFVAVEPRVFHRTAGLCWSMSRPSFNPLFSLLTPPRNERGLWTRRKIKFYGISERSRWRRIDFRSHFPADSTDVYDPSKSGAAPGGHFEVKSWVLLTISNPNFKWL